MNKFEIMEKQFNCTLPEKALYESKSYVCTSAFLSSFIDDKLVTNSTTLHDMCVMGYNRKKNAYTFVGNIVLEIAEKLSTEKFDLHHALWLKLKDGSEVSIDVTSTRPPSENNLGERYSYFVTEICYRLQGAKHILTRIYGGYVFLTEEDSSRSKYSQTPEGLIADLQHYGNALINYGPESANHSFLYHQIFSAIMHPYLVKVYDNEMYMCLPYDEIDQPVLDIFSYITSTDRQEIECMEFNYRLLGKDNMAIYAAVIGSTGPAFKSYADGYDRFTYVDESWVMFSYESVMHIMECSK